MCIAITITLSTRQLQTDTTIVLVAVECRQKLVLAVVAFKVRKILSKQLFIVTSTSFTVGFVCQLLEYKTYCIITEEPQEIAILVQSLFKESNKKCTRLRQQKKLRGLPAFFYSHRCVPRLLDFLIALAGKLFFWPSFLRGGRRSRQKKKHSNQNCPRGEQQLVYCNPYIAS